MEEKTIQIPADAERVTLEIKREAGKPRMGCTLRDAIMMTPVTRPLVVRVCENLRYSERPLAWDLGFAGINPPSPEHDCCAARVERLLQCRLCDASKLLTRIVTAVGIETRTTGGDAIVYEVEIDGE